MALIKQNVMGAFQGKVGTLTTYNAAAGNIARIRTNATNRGEGASRTDRQQTNRVRWANMVNFYKASKKWMPKAFENKKKGLSDYNRFMSVNFNFSSVALTKSEAAAGACVVEAYLISQGSLAPVQVQNHGDHWDTNIHLGDLTIGETTTVAQLSSAMIANNNFLREGMQLSCISYQQQVDDLGTPRVICTAYEMIIDTKATDKKAFDFLPSFCLASENGVLRTSNNISVGGFAYVLSETVSGRTMVSTQNLIVNNAALIAQYTSAEQYDKAIASYGTTGEVFLDADYAESKNPTPQPLYVSEVYAYNGTRVVPVDTHPQVDSIFDNSLATPTKIVMSAVLGDKPVRSVALVCTEEGNPLLCNIVKVDGNQIIVKGLYDWGSSFGAHLATIRVNVADVWYEFPVYDPNSTNVVE